MLLTIARLSSPSLPALRNNNALSPRIARRRRASEEEKRRREENGSKRGRAFDERATNEEVMTA